MKKNVVFCVKLQCDLHEITEQSEANGGAISVKTQCVLNGIEWQEDWNEGIEAIKWLHTGIECGFLFLFGDTEKC